MADEIIGTAVLTRDHLQTLVMVCRKAGGQAFLTRIPVYAEGDAPRTDPAWAYRIEGDVLHVSPSVLIRYQVPPDETWIQRFHNGYHWSVKFRWAEAMDPNEVWQEAVDLNRNIPLSYEL